ncbi:hypothetical protein [Streptomyces sp. NBC_01565]|uniref:hypothetical protein n=1 Tax=unclassified Streptomyces TaxID=2593676 RepID=UPI002250839E|nr:hypothetical protein [Streptomyces sp. NBC_01565]MCX4546855.1 hypothetical protein [Streptomyces sp. NBC_01565]
MDPGFDLACEAFSAMVTLMLLPPGKDGTGRELAARLACQTGAGRWRQRYRIFPRGNGFPAETDCTGIAAGALHGHGLLPAPDLEACVRDLLRGAAPAGMVPGPYRRGDDTALRQRQPRSASDNVK